MAAVLIGSAVLITVVVLGLRWWSHRSARTTVPAPGSGPAHTDLPTFDVVALGTRGSGKTMLLASMYSQLQTRSGRGYYVTAPFDQVVRLNQWFGEVADPQAGWPRSTGTGETRLFSFTVHTEGAYARPLPVLTVNYLDYAGGLLTDPEASGPDLTELCARIDSAHALIGIIDGFWIRRLIDGDLVAKTRMQQIVTTMVHLMLRVDRPVTFVITKWDLLQDIAVDEDERLGFVRKHLMHNQNFRDLVNAHAAHRVVRLVPVSSVGPDFTALDHAGIVVKRPDGELRPTNADLPFAAVVPDVWDQIEQGVDQAELAAVFARLGGPTAKGRAAALSDAAGMLTQAAGRVFGLVNPVAGTILDLAAGLHRGPSVEQQVSTALSARDERSGVEAELRFNRQARITVLRELRSRVDVLEGRLPSSRLGSEV